MPASRGALILTLILTLILALGTAGATDLPLGAWVGVDDADQALLVEPARAVRHAGGDAPPRFWRLTHDAALGDVLVLESNAAAVAVPFERDGDRLVLDWRGDGGEIAYRRVDQAPDTLAVEALDLPPTSTRLDFDRIDFDRIDAIVDELVRRRADDQRVRRPGAFDTPEGVSEMVRVDRDNTAWLRETIRDVGWIDAARFGGEAARGAFLIVQHSGDLALMSAALPAIEADVRLGLLDGGGFALLHDRLALNLGRRQRYGSQLGTPRGEQRTYLLPLEDRDAVDERRAEMGMTPLADYLEFFGGDEVVFYDDVADERARAAVAALAER